ncbi:MAG TPA: hypothetical protein VG986_17565 [Pseudolabrys sp.]|nr:hypothetical protein [Pseudolabrys sp.]
MAKLTPYVGTHSGDLKIWVALFDIGSGQFKNFGDYQMEFQGSYDFAGQSGSFDIAVSLTDQQPNSPSGPCTVTLNGNTDTGAHYQTQNGKLTVTTALNQVPIDLHVKGSGTQVDNISGHNLWIG